MARGEFWAQHSAMADGYNEPDFGEYGSTTDANDKKDRWGVSILDDLLRWMPDWTFRVDAFPSECLTLVRH